MPRARQRCGRNSPGSCPSFAGQVFAFCWPVQNEPDLRPLMQALHADGKRIVLPVVVRPGEPLAFREWWPEQPLVPDRYDIPMPTDGDFLIPQILLLPVNAFDAAGFRIGYGAVFSTVRWQRCRRDRKRSASASISSRCPRHARRNTTCRST